MNLTKNELINFLKNDFKKFETVSHRVVCKENSVDFFMKEISKTKYNALEAIKSALEKTTVKRRAITNLVWPQDALTELAYAISFLDENFRKAGFPYFQDLFEEKSDEDKSTGQIDD
jgi:hypothetical protein